MSRRKKKPSPQITLISLCQGKCDSCLWSYKVLESEASGPTQFSLPAGLHTGPGTLIKCRRTAPPVELPGFHILLHFFPRLVTSIEQVQVLEMEYGHLPHQL